MAALFCTATLRKDHCSVVLIDTIGCLLSAESAVVKMRAKPFE